MQTHLFYILLLACVVVAILTICPAEARVAMEIPTVIMATDRYLDRGYLQNRGS